MMNQKEELISTFSTAVVIKKLLHKTANDVDLPHQPEVLG